MNMPNINSHLSDIIGTISKSDISFNMIHIVVILKKSMHVINRSGMKVYQFFHYGVTIEVKCWWLTNISLLPPIICKFSLFSGVMTIFWND